MRLTSAPPGVPGVPLDALLPEHTRCRAATPGWVALEGGLLRHDLPSGERRRCLMTSSSRTDSSFFLPMTAERVEEGEEASEQA